MEYVAFFLVIFLASWLFFWPASYIFIVDPKVTLKGRFRVVAATVVICNLTVLVGALILFNFHRLF